MIIFASMRRILSIPFVLAAVAVMLSMSVVPHHHHGAAACLTAHSCGGGECDDDHHPHESEGTDHPGGCVVETPFVEPSERNDKTTCCGSPDCDHDGHAHFFALAQLYFDLFPDEPIVNTDYGEPIIRYKSIDACTGGGLRAPPAILC